MVVTGANVVMRFSLQMMEDMPLPVIRILLMLFGLISG